jgi:hypothetical protein
MAQAANPGVDAVLRAIDKRWWLRHGLFWAVRTALMTWLFLYGLHTSTDWRIALRDSLILLPPLLLLTYSLLYGVLPGLERPEHRGRYALLLVAWLGLGLALTFAHRYYFFVPSHRGHSPFSDYHLVYATGAHMPVLLTCGVAAGLRAFRQRQQQAYRNTQLAQENYQAELQLLRAQIHPHFLFNTLNNLYALTLKQSDQAPVVVERLTGLLHFVVEQGNAPFVSLTDEVALLRNYLALEQMRYGPRLTLDFAADGIVDTVRIAPLLLLPLVENAFKHGPAEQVGAARISIALAVAGGWFTCIITNTKSPGPSLAPQTAGIGLHNVRQRLQLLYPQRHRFTLEAGEETFTVCLALRLAAESEAAPQMQPLLSAPFQGAAGAIASTPAA